MINPKELSERIDSAEWATDELRARLGEFILELDKAEDNAALEEAQAEIEKLKAEVEKVKADHDAWVINKVYRGIVEDEVVDEEALKKAEKEQVTDEDEIEDFDINMI